MTENVARKNLTYMEEARAYAGYFKVYEDFHQPNLIGQKDPDSELSIYSKRIGVSVHTIYSRIALLSLSEPVQSMVENGTIALGQAEAPHARHG